MSPSPIEFHRVSKKAVPLLVLHCKYQRELDMC
uniref:Uncharacterized protein n=1 Tax=Arundo donax TaxID=35708 RepID=A0A0A9HQW3_ARUDO